MRSNTKMKVRVADLLAALRARQEDEARAYVKALAKYEAEKGSYNERAKDALLKLADQAGRGKLTRTWRGISEVLPEEPTKPTKPDELSAPIRFLEMAADETITISSDDYRWYLR